MTPQEATFRLREWYQAFEISGKGDERSVKALLEAADLIDSMTADLDTLRQFTKELSARNEELRKEKLTLSLRVKQLEAERAALLAAVKMHSSCCFCKHHEAHVIVCEEADYCCDKCGVNGCACATCDELEKQNWEWRGVHKEE